MAYAPLFSFGGAQQPTEIFQPDTVQRHPLGSRFMGVDPYWGFGDFIYLQSAAAIPLGTALIWSAAFVAAVNPTTANTGRPVGFCRETVSATGQFFWAQIGGTCPVLAPSAAAGPLYQSSTTAGTLTTTAATGRQILNANCITAAAGTVVKVGQQRNGDTRILFSNTDGFFVGQALTGTGVGASAVISSIDPNQRLIIASVASTATNSTNITATNTGFGVAQLNSPFVQGQIT